MTGPRKYLALAVVLFSCGTIQTPTAKLAAAEHLQPRATYKKELRKLSQGESEPATTKLEPLTKIEPPSTRLEPTKLEPPPARLQPPTRSSPTRLQLTKLEPLTKLARLARLEPPTGAYVGIILKHETPMRTLERRLGFMPAVVARYFTMDKKRKERTALKSFITHCREAGVIAMVTLEPIKGLETVDQALCEQFSNVIAEEDKRGAMIMLRFAHEMNGDWYSWGMQPALYKEKFRMLARAIHKDTTRTAMIWAPTDCRGYPFQKHPYSADLDTDHDGKITSADDGYTPFYPGDEYVDWVGLSLYHWGVTYPFGDNVMPPADEFARTVYGAPGDSRGHSAHSSANGSVSFYQTFCVTHQKPMMIAETAALFNVCAPAGPGERQIKQDWIEQVFAINSGTSGDLIEHPKLKCINWFDISRKEPEIKGDVIDWTISRNPLVKALFLKAIGQTYNGQQYFLQAKDLTIDSNGLWKRRSAEN